MPTCDPVSGLLCMSKLLVSALCRRNFLTRVHAKKLASTTCLAAQLSLGLSPPFPVSPLFPGTITVFDVQYHVHPVHQQSLQVQRLQGFGCKQASHIAKSKHEG
jgi:hypothetical protein